MASLLDMLRASNKKIPDSDSAVTTTTAGSSSSVSATSTMTSLARTEEEVCELTARLCRQWTRSSGTRSAAAATHPSYVHIPRFHRKLPAEGDLLQQRLREEARTRHVQRQSRMMLNNSDLDVVWALLQTRFTNQDQEERMITFDAFLLIGEEAGEKFNAFFTSTVFAKLYQQDAKGRISINRLYAYIMRKVWLHQTRIGLSLYDTCGTGILTEMDLESYILELIPTLPLLKGLEDSFYSFFVCTAVRKFFFFLDPLRTGKLKIQDIMSCKFLDDLLELRDETLSLQHQQGNWFSAPHALRVYGQYLSLDLDHNGMLSKQELLGYGSGTLTPVFVDRVFDECLTYEGEMDYKSYLDFVLAMENRKEPQSLHFFMRLLDIQNLGHLDMFALYYFFKDIQRMLDEHSQAMVNFEDIKDEIFDMVKPADPLKISLDDLMKSGQGATVVGILIDLKGFWLYENREQLAAEPASADDEDDDDDSDVIAGGVTAGGDVTLEDVEDDDDVEELLMHARHEEEMRHMATVAKQQQQQQDQSRRQQQQQQDDDDEDEDVQVTITRESIGSGGVDV